jgi:hypothetical protein
MLVIGALPGWPYSIGRGYYPSGMGLIVLVVLLVVLFRWRTGEAEQSLSEHARIDPSPTQTLWRNGLSA